MFLVAASPLNIHAQESSPRGLPSVFNRFGPTREAAEIAARPHRDGYLLVLLADQELAAGRREQAMSLLEAAYTAFDEVSEAGEKARTLSR